MKEGNLEEGELEIGQISSRLKDIISAREVVEQTMSEFHQVCRRLGNISSI